ncbi:hypothetical protein [Zhihengliuella flava]|uniref:Uncharacterized protein n=1 Tax=Zhihengliuella flava TaxID=1285193 RepID=A0A931GMW7_9MICC|nr:hypothetical protein [Zhihengliuella flava]MBG6085834.1 hypothetical protein [Zhihengliuella flava]
MSGIPDINVDWEPSAWCPICEDGGDMAVIDTEALECTDCGTTWSIDGRHGESSLDRPELDTPR